MNTLLRKSVVLLVLLLGCLVTQSAFGGATDTLYVTSGNGTPGTGNHEIHVIMKNGVPVRGMTMHLVDTEAALDVASVDVNDTYINHFAVYNTATDSGRTRMLLLPYQQNTLTTITAGRDTILSMNISVGAEAEGGTNTALNLDSLLVVDDNLEMEPFNVVNGQFWLGTKGDVVYSVGGVVDLRDVLKMLDIVLNRHTPTAYQVWAGDLNEDGEINIIDILDAIDLALSGTTPTKSLGGSTETFGTGSATLSIPALPAGKTGEVDLPIRLTNSVPVMGVQLTLRVDPEEVAFSGINVSPISENMIVKSRVSGPELTLMLLSQDGKPIPTGEHTLCSLPVEIQHELETSREVIISRAMVGGEDSELIETRFSGEPALADKGLPKSFQLYQNNPNPFNMSTTFTYDIPDLNGEAVNVQLAVYNTQGQLVRLVEDRMRTPGQYSVQWNGQDRQGKTISSGVYFYKLIAGDHVLTRKLAVMK
jgi:hypothetical protein